MTEPADIKSHFLRCLDGCEAGTAPYRHWLLADVFPEAVSTAMRDLPIAPADIEDTESRRETNNESRVFFSAKSRARHDVRRQVAEALQDPDTVARLGQLCGVELGGGFLRIEYCQDTDGFWLEPHTDIGAKMFTMLVYLSTDPGAGDWGTDIYDRDMNHVATAPYAFNHGLIFIPGEDTWHGFRKRPIGGVRKSIIVNYVKDEWRARHELAYPNQPVGRQVPRI